VLELCAGTLEDYCCSRYTGPMPNDELVLLQLSRGLQYIHSKNLTASMNIHPRNVFISKIRPVKMKWSGFHNLKLNTVVKDICMITKLREWAPPEVNEGWQNKTTILCTTFEIDIFIAGCLFFYFLTRGQCLFSTDDSCQSEVRGGKVNLLKGRIFP